MCQAVIEDFSRQPFLSEGVKTSGTARHACVFCAIIFWLLLKICKNGTSFLYTRCMAINPFMDGSFSEWLACAESAPHLPSYLTAGAKQ